MEDDRIALERVGDALTEMERIVERDLANHLQDADVEMFNSVLSEGGRALHGLQTRMKLSLGTR